MNPALILALIEKGAEVYQSVRAKQQALSTAAVAAGLSQADVDAAVARGEAAADTLGGHADAILSRLNAQTTGPVTAPDAKHIATIIWGD